MQIEQRWVKLIYKQNKENWTKSTTKKQENLKRAKWDFAWILTLERKWKTPGWIPQNALKVITFVKGWLNFSCKSTTSANIDLTESPLDNWLKNNHIITMHFNTNFSFQIYFSNAENRKTELCGNTLKLDLIKPIKWEHWSSVGICDWQAEHLSLVI